jgi:branched-chain amino acid aminotransferase
LGISIYEVIRIIQGKTLFFEEHYQRLIRSAQLLSIDLWISEKEIKNQMFELAKANEVINGNIGLIFHIHNNEKSFQCLFIEDRYPSSEMYEKGVPTQLYYAERETPGIKKINLNLREKTVNEIIDNEIYEVLLVGKDNFITEGSRSNIFLIKENTVYTPPIESVLPGITRDKIIDVCHNLNYTLIEKKISVNELGDFEAAFYTGTSPKAIPISSLEETTYDPLHPVLQSIIKEYDNLIEKYLININNQAINIKGSI